MATFIANRDGFVNGHYVFEGESFEYDGACPEWATPVAPNTTAKGEGKGRSKGMSKGRANVKATQPQN